MNTEFTPGEALTQLLVNYIAAKDQLVAAAIANHPMPGHASADLAAGNLKSQIIVDDGWLRIILLIAATGAPLEQPLLHFTMPKMEIKGRAH